MLPPTTGLTRSKNLCQSTNQGVVCLAPPTLARQHKSGAHCESRGTAKPSSSGVVTAKLRPKPFMLNQYSQGLLALLECAFQGADWLAELRSPLLLGFGLTCTSEGRFDDFPETLAQQLQWKKLCPLTLTASKPHSVHFRWPMWHAQKCSTAQRNKAFNAIVSKRN